MKRYSLLLIPLAVWMVGFWNPLKAYIAWPAGSGFEITPSGSDSVAQGDDRIREFKEQVRLRAQVEHHWGTSVSSSDNGRHREGSAVAWDEAACPTGNITGDPATGTTAYGATDDGRLCRDSTTGELKMWTGAAYVTVPTASSGDGSGHFNLLSGLTFQKAGADAMDIHAHHTRHGINGISGAWTVGADHIPLTIADIIDNNTFDSAACASVPTTAIGSQVFGDAGVACMSIKPNLTGRVASSRGIVLVQLTTKSDGTAGTSCQVRFNVYLDTIADPEGTEGIANYNNTNEASTSAMILQMTGLSAGAHEIALHVSDADDPGCAMVSGRMIWVDLGVS